MDIKEYIESGILELYVAGALSEIESKEVYDLMLKHPEILDEVLKIEASIMSLSQAVSPRDSKYIYSLIKEKLGLGGSDSKVISLKEPRTINWFNYSGWAASILLAGGLIWALVQNNELKTQITKADTDIEFLETQIENANSDLKEANNFIATLRDRNIITVPLDGQAVYPEAYAKVYWDKATNNIFLDAQGLPDPPPGKVYQVWSLKLDPLTPTSLGVIDTFTTDNNKIFVINNPNESEAFGITLEPEGGSESPTLEQLYTLGVVSNNASS